MTQANILQQAKQGDVRAIAALLNRSLQPKGVTVKAVLKDSCLQLLLESVQVPPQQQCVSFVINGLIKLQPQHIQSVQLCGQQQGEQMPAWMQQIDLQEAMEPVAAASPVCCPQCKNTQILASKRGFGVGEAVLGAVLLGPIGLAGGLIGANQVFLNCLSCGHKWQVGTATAAVKAESMPSEAKVERMSFPARVGIGVALAFFGGLISALFLGHLAIGAAFIILLGFLFGVDEWTTTIVGNCPHCGTAASLGFNQKSQRCNSCQNSFNVERRSGQYLFVPKT